MEQVLHFSERFGFFSVDFNVKQTLKEVKEFAAECGLTGCYKGIPVEGFVVRCSRLIDQNQLDYFFKIKFDNPYLMFREWRELTLMIIKGQQPKRFKFDISEDYVKWAQATFRQNPLLFSRYEERIGIIHLRNLFLLQVKGLNSTIGPDIINLCIKSVIKRVADTRVAKSSKILLIPVATIGAGKTTLARSLTILYPNLIGHIQNDDVKVKSAARVFEQRIMNDFLIHDVVIADRNNHLQEHRRDLSNAFLAEYPNGTIIALDWKIQALDRDRVILVTTDRIQSRGENHQSLTPGRTPDYKKIICSFVYRRDGLDIENESDSLVQKVLEMNLEDSTEIQIAEVCIALGITVPILNLRSDAVGIAKGYTESVKKEIKQRPIFPSFYGVKIGSDVSLLIKEYFQGSHKAVWDSFESGIHFKELRGWHATIAVRMKSDLTTKYDKAWKQAKVAGNRDLISGDPLGLGKEVEFTLGHICWNERVMAIEITDSVPVVKSINKILHITFATQGPDVKPVESNQLLNDYHSASTAGMNCIKLPNLKVRGVIEAFL